jgi:hypothetical protein
MRASQVNAVPRPSARAQCGGCVMYDVQDALRRRGGGRRGCRACALRRGCRGRTSVSNAAVSGRRCTAAYCSRSTCVYHPRRCVDAGRVRERRRAAHARRWAATGASPPARCVLCCALLCCALLCCALLCCALLCCAVLCTRSLARSLSPPLPSLPRFCVGCVWIGGGERVCVYVVVVAVHHVSVTIVRRLGCLLLLVLPPALV